MFAHRPTPPGVRSRATLRRAGRLCRAGPIPMRQGLLSANSALFRRSLQIAMSYSDRIRVEARADRLRCPRRCGSPEPTPRTSNARTYAGTVISRDDAERGAHTPRLIYSRSRPQPSRIIAEIGRLRRIARRFKLRESPFSQLSQYVARCPRRRHPRRGPFETMRVQASRLQALHQGLRGSARLLHLRDFPVRICRQAATTSQ